MFSWNILNMMIPSLPPFHWMVLRDTIELNRLSWVASLSINHHPCSSGISMVHRGPCSIRTGIPHRMNCTSEPHLPVFRSALKIMCAFCAMIKRCHIIIRAITLTRIYTIYTHQTITTEAWNLTHGCPLAAEAEAPHLTHTSDPLGK